MAGGMAAPPVGPLQGAARIMASEDRGTNWRRVTEGELLELSGRVGSRR